MSAPTKSWKQRMKQEAVALAWIALCSLVGLTLLFGALVLLLPSATPPKETHFIENFHAHRVAYERLRTMLQADRQLLHVNNSGIETTKSSRIRNPIEVGFPVERYNEYVALLKETGALAAIGVGEGNGDSVGALVWMWQWAGDSRHIDICWLDHKPDNQVASLDDFHQTSRRNYSNKPPGAFKQIEGNWYLWGDW